MERIPYDEFSMFHENAEEFGLPYDGPPTVRRASRWRWRPGRQLSALVWGDADPELVFLHGGAQNAHTWDTVAMALGRPLVALDLPGHGHSDGGREGSSDSEANAEDVAVAIRALGARRAGGRRHVARRHDHDRAGRPRPRAGAQGGAGRRDARRQRVEVVDHRRVHQRARELRQLRRPARPHHRVQPDPHRGVAPPRDPAQRRAARGRLLGVALPAVPRLRAQRPPTARAGAPELPVPVGRGVAHRGARCCSPAACASSRSSTTTTRSSSLRRLPNAQVEHFEEAGHSLQGDTPVELAQSIEKFVFG